MRASRRQRCGNSGLSVAQSVPARSALALTCALLLHLPGALWAEKSFSLPAELSQGLVFQPGLDPFTFSVQIHPGIAFGQAPAKHSIGLTGAAVYANPEWVYWWGGRLAVHVKTFKKKPVSAGPNVKYATVRFVAEVLAEELDVRRITGGWTLDIWHGALEITPRAGYDYRQEGPLLEVALGIELIPR
jgi:hypothetical protein